MQAAAVLAAAWLLAIPLTSSSQPEVASAVRGSTVLGKVDEVAPEWLRQVPKEFSALLDTSGLPDVIGPFGRTPVADVAVALGESPSGLAVGCWGCSPAVVVVAAAQQDPISEKAGQWEEDEPVSLRIPTSWSRVHL